ncbi:sensor domain-containing protein [Paenibacillus sinopodophylli]|uniref:sensor domain-containing protein n=1 Tax=Paenibacillus sinopodophylli TaxID=1837342 RepID=UPI00110CDB7F|nr:sensor domain-containing protein [Paenibacillus sinopodophylli]
MRATIQESVVVLMKKKSALQAWKMLILSLPKGIMAFVVIVVGLSVSLPLSVFLIGVPLLAATLSLSKTLMVGESKIATRWILGQKHPADSDLIRPTDAEQQGWRSWLLSVLKDGRSYRGILFGIIQLPISIAAFTVAIVLPVTAFAVLLSPVAYEVSMRMFDFNLFSSEWELGLSYLFDWSLTSAQRSWIAGGVGLVFVLLLPLVLKRLGLLYAAWILSVAGPEPVRVSSHEEMYIGRDFAFSTENP